MSLAVKLVVNSRSLNQRTRNCKGQKNKFWFEAKRRHYMYVKDCSRWRRWASVIKCSAAVTKIQWPSTVYIDTFRSAIWYSIHCRTGSHLSLSIILGVKLSNRPTLQINRSAAFITACVLHMICTWRRTQKQRVAVNDPAKMKAWTSILAASWDGKLRTQRSQRIW